MKEEMPLTLISKIELQLRPIDELDVIFQHQQAQLHEQLHVLYKRAVDI